MSPPIRTQHLIHGSTSQTRCSMNNLMVSSQLIVIYHTIRLTTSSTFRLTPLFCQNYQLLAYEMPDLELALPIQINHYSAHALTASGLLTCLCSVIATHQTGCRQHACGPAAVNKERLKRGVQMMSSGLRVGDAGIEPATPSV